MKCFDNYRIKIFPIKFVDKKKNFSKFYVCDQLICNKYSNNGNCFEFKKFAPLICIALYIFILIPKYLGFTCLITRRLNSSFVLIMICINILFPADSRLKQVWNTTAKAKTSRYIKARTSLSPSSVSNSVLNSGNRTPGARIIRSLRPTL
jgi:hypothetical protein